MKTLNRSGLVLTDSIVQQIAERLEKPEESTRFLLRLHIRRHGADTIARRIYDRISNYSKRKSRPWELGSIFGIGAYPALVVIQRLEDSKAFPVVGLGGIVVSVGLGISMTLLQRYVAKSTVKNEPVRESLGEYVDIPDYRNRISFHVSCYRRYTICN